MKSTRHCLFSLLVLASTPAACHADPFALTTTSSLISYEPSAIYHTGGPGVKADVQIGSTNSYSCMNVSISTRTADLTYFVFLGLYSDPGNPNAGFTAPNVQQDVSVILMPGEKWTLSGVSAGSTEPVAIGGYYCYSEAALDENKTGEAYSSNTPQFDVTVEQ